MHAYITERFEVVRGTVRLHLDGRDELARPGEAVEVPPGVVHDWWNDGDDEAHVRVEVRPGARFELMIQNLYGLANDGKTDGRGVPRLLPLSLFATEFRREGEFIRPAAGRPARALRHGRAGRPRAWPQSDQSRVSRPRGEGFRRPVDSAGCRILRAC